MLPVLSGTELFRAEALPVLQNKTFATSADACASPTGDVVLVQDHRTGLVRNDAFDPSRVIYDVDYQNEQACSPAFQRHLDEVTRVIERLLTWSYEDRVANACIGAERADLVLAGCAILDAIRRAFPCRRLRVADRGLREGMLVQMMREDGVWGAETLGAETLGAETRAP